mgnify:CR=1 FL=1
MGINLVDAHMIPKQLFSLLKRPYTAAEDTPRLRQYLSTLNALRDNPSSLFISSVLLFYGGMAFAYYVVFPLVFLFFTSIAPEGISVMPDIRSYLDFVLKLFFAFGLSFEIPIAVVILSWMGVVEPDNLAKKRPYVFVLCFVLGMLLTPPDIISQTLLAIPMWLLFEVGILFGRLVSPSQTEA